MLIQINNYLIIHFYTDSIIQVVCQQNQDDGTVIFVPHPYNCSKYFMCFFDQGMEMSCPGNLQFDPNLNVCNYPENVGCVNSTPQPTTTEVITTTQIIGKFVGLKSIFTRKYMENWS